MSRAAPQFVFMTCRPGAETALKQEVARSEPEWRLAYSRPGFATFKCASDGRLVDEPIDDKRLAERSWVLARTHGLSLGKVTGEELATLARQVWELVRDEPFGDIHVWQRDAERSEDASGAPGATPLAAEIERAIRAAASASCDNLREPPGEQRRPAARDARVLDVVVVEPHEWWIGYHRVVTPPQRWPGGAIPVRTPEHAVSRAYTKLAEALAWSGLPIAEDDECVELGCAPGGASQALLDRGLYVTGIDPAEVDPILLAHPRFRQLRKRSKEVRRSEYLGVRWLAADMNLAPSYTLDAVEAIVTHADVHIRGMILTLKLADWSQADRLAEYAARVHGWGYRDVRMRQLASGGQEVCLVALRRKELRRLSRKRKGRVQKGSNQGERASARGQVRRDPPHPAPAGPHFQAQI
jgi:23S rRNA (cytidine2498-2'-O)-methyltransferase